MILRYTRKGKNLLVEEAEFQEYITKQFRELLNLSTNVVAALIMISLIVVFFWIDCYPPYRTHLYSGNGLQVAEKTF